MIFNNALYSTLLDNNFPEDCIIKSGFKCINRGYKKILLTCFSQSDPANQNKMCQHRKKDLYSHITSSNIIISHGTFEHMLLYKHQVFIYGHNHLSNLNVFKDGNQDQYFFMHNNSFYINVSLKLNQNLFCLTIIQLDDDDTTEIITLQK